MADLNQIAESLSQLTVMQAAELVKMLETKWGVSAAAPVAMAAAPAAGGGGGAGGPAAPGEKTFVGVFEKKGGEKNGVNKGGGGGGAGPGPAGTKKPGGRAPQKVKERGTKSQ